MRGTPWSSGPSFGGVVYNSYNCLPGWSPAMPLRQLLITHGAGSAEPTIARLDKALAFAARLAELGAAYFAHNPGVGRRLEGMREASRNYLAHEYLNRDWNPQYHAEVAAEMSEAKLSFAASAHLADHLDALNLSAEARQLLAGIGDPVFRETVRDIYVKGALRLSAPEQRELLTATRFALLTPRDEVPMKAAFALGEASFQEEVYGPVLDGLATGPAMLGELLARPAIAPIGLPRVLEALTVLTAGGHAAPGLPEDGQDERRTRTDAFNAAVLERARFHGELQALASPVTGGGVPLGRFDQLFLLARKKDDADPGGFAWSVLEAQGQRIVKDGRALESAEDNRAELRARAEAFHARRLEVLQSLGVT